MAPQRQKFSAQVERSLLQALREIASEEGRPLHVVMEEAMRQYIERKRDGGSRDVMSRFRTSVEENRRLGELLAQ